MYIYNLQKISCLKWNNFVWIFIYIFKLHFFTRWLYFHLWWRERGKKSILQLFWRMLLEFEEKKLEIHKIDWLVITWILKKLKSIQTLVNDLPEIKLSHWYPLNKTYIKNHIQKLKLSLSWTNFCYPNYRLVPLWILNYWEFNCSCSSHFLSY